MTGRGLFVDLAVIVLAAILLAALAEYTVGFGGITFIVVLLIGAIVVLGGRGRP